MTNLKEAEQRYWAEFYNTRFYPTGIPYSIFIKAPRHCADLVNVWEDQTMYQPLLREQKSVLYDDLIQEGFITEEDIDNLRPAHAVQRGSQLIEPLHHHAHNINRQGIA